MKKNLLLLSILLVVLLIGCSINSNNAKLKEFTESEVVSNFPIPVGSELKERYAGEGFKQGVKYLYKNIGGEQGLYPSEKYLKVIEQQGWVENKAERMGHKYQFEKSGRVIWFIIHEDFFDVIELK